MHNKYETGLKLLNQLHGSHTGEALVKQFRDICPTMADITIATVFGEIMSRPQLDLKTRELCVIAALITQGHPLPQIRAHTEAALTTGASKQEIIEVFLQTIFVAGFPACVNALISIKDLIID